MSAVMSDQSVNNVAEFFTPGPGERLSAARLSMGFDLAKIASELHLTSAVVAALEADDYSEIQARVFVRGYLRNYARIVGMPVESILRQFDEKWPDDSARQTVVRQSPKLPADGGPSRGWAGAMTWLLIVGMVVLFLMWWRGYLDEIVPQQIRTGSLIEGGATARGDAVESTADGMMLDVDPALADGSLRLPPPSPEVAVEPEPAPATDGGRSVQLPESEAGLSPVLPPPVETTVDATTVSSVRTEPLTVSPPGPAAGVSSRNEDPDALTLVPGAGASEGAPVVDRTKQVVLTFNAACWVDVRDSERKFKLFGEMPKGERKVLAGQPPYKLVIGNAQAVSITVDGKPFDLAAHAKGNVARFTLDP